ncbi:peptidoglycan recognition protein 1-like [Bombyx mandarina]|uniref:Peptidoglycan recognition protein 1-like n=1 Tax=Bombyx mandarina TaxID=7092 RepID=A0A6J2JVF3_BOMMA|nr:peptidoglycan recognition protein 1-like [Bombyx mandarina]
MYRPDCSSDFVLMDERMIASASRAAVSPPISQLNVSKSSRVHIGPKFVSVTQKVRNTEEIKELPLPRYLWKVLKNTSRAERLSCSVALTALVICIGLTLYFALTTETVANDDDIDVAPHEWNITREMWLAQIVNDTESVREYNPIRLVIVQHTVSPECDTFQTCASQMRILQSNVLHNLEDDIPYNFLIGNDGRVYEGRGWGLVGAHTYHYNRCSLGIGFLGDYREELDPHTRVTDLQIARTKILLEDGVKRGFLHPKYYINGACDFQSTASPGSNLYKALKSFEHFDHKGILANRTCDEIYTILKNKI